MGRSYQRDNGTGVPVGIRVVHGGSRFGVKA
jgi:hypothetical protein